MKNFWFLLILMGATAHAALIANTGFEVGTGLPTTTSVGTGAASSLSDWNQWSNSGSVTTAQSSDHVLAGSFSAHITGGVNDGLFQYGALSPDIYTASGWFWVSSGSAEIGLFDNGGSTGGFSAPTTETGKWVYVSFTDFLAFGFMGPVIYTASPESDVYADAFWMNAGETTTSPFAPSTGFDPLALDVKTDDPILEDTAPAVPEPGTLGLMMLGLVSLAAIARSRRA